MEFGFQMYFFILCGISVVEPFSWLNCGKPTEPAKVLSLDAYFNETETLYVTGRGKLAMNLTSPIKGEVDMQRKFFWGWTKIPCMEQVGSCTYDDVCELSPYKTNTTCPPDFTKNELPCKCPILEGQYTAKKFPINLDVLPKWLEKGKYRIKFTLSKDDKEIICLIVYIDL